MQRTVRNVRKQLCVDIHVLMAVIIDLHQYCKKPNNNGAESPNTGQFRRTVTFTEKSEIRNHLWMFLYI